MPRGCAGRAVFQHCMGLCAELEHPCFTSDGKLTAACATPWSLSPCKLCFEVGQKQRTPPDATGLASAAGAAAGRGAEKQMKVFAGKMRAQAWGSEQGQERRRRQHWGSKQGQSLWQGVWLSARWRGWEMRPGPC